MGITVSPDLGLRNTTTHIFDTILINKTIESNDSLADRNRRLIPYMTFYMPNDFPAGQHYNFIPEQQQKQMVSPYQSHYPQRIRIEHHQQPHHFQIRYPTQRPKYQALLYGTRHQIANQGNSHHQALPLFKDSGPMKSRPVHQQHSTPKVKLTPFVPSNKLPGQFTPIIYVHPTDNVDYNRNPQSSTSILQQYNEVVNEQQNYHEEQEGLQSPVVAYTTPNPKLPMLVSPSPRPLYPILNEARQNQNSQPQHPVLVQQQPERTPSLTPQQKYVEYLKEQLRYKQQQYYEQHHEPAFIINASPSPPLASNVISYDKPEQIPINQIVYQPQSAHSGDDAVEESYNRSPSTRPIEYNYAQSPQSYDYNHSPSPRPSTHNSPNYVDVIVQEPQQIGNLPPEKQVEYKPINYITTPSPITVSSISPMYEHADPEPFRPVETIKSPMPIEISEQPEPKRPLHNPQLKYKPDRKPAYISQPSLAPQTIRQHLTETTQVPPLVLTTYHPNFVSSKPKYNSPISSPRPLYKSKIAQKFKPIVVSKPVPQSITRPNQQATIPIENFSNITHNSLADILHKLQDSNQLPKTFTPDNIDNSIRTLIKILNNLKQSQTIVENPPQHHEEDYDDYADTPIVDPSHPSPNSGRPGIDYPNLSEIPHTSFNCKEQRYKGFFGDPETNCQVWHYCDLNGGQASFLCPNGTIFSQVALTCDWWFNVKCSSTAQLYVLNERLYKYILPLTPKFPEDYSGPLVDKYLALKFREMEDKMRREKAKGKTKSEEESEEEDDEEGNGNEENVHSTTQNSEKAENQGADGNTQTIVVTTTPSIPSLQSMPIVVTSTEESFSSNPTSAKTSVESEKVEVIEIKTDGTSGHLIPPRIFNSGLKK